MPTDPAILSAGKGHPSVEEPPPIDGNAAAAAPIDSHFACHVNTSIRCVAAGVAKCRELVGPSINECHAG